MESLDGVTSRSPTTGQEKQWMARTNTALQVLGGFFHINGIYFALFATSLYTALVYYSFVLMVLTAVGYCYYFTADDVERLLQTGLVAGFSMVDSLDLPGARSSPNVRSAPERQRL